MTGCKSVRRTAAAAAAIIVMSATSATATERRTSPSAEISIPAGTLEDGLLALGRQSKVRLLYASDATEGKRAKAVKADTFESALRELLEGTGLVYVYTAPDVVTVQNLVKVQASGTVELDEINVEGQARNGDSAQDPTGHVAGFVASRALTATKTDTPLIETPQSVSVVTSDQIARQGAQSLGATLRYTAGVAGEINGGSDTRYGGFQLRGFEATGNSFYKDGLRLPGTAYAEFLPLDPYGAERIEILKGPASVLYGQNGPGGVINYVSKRPTDEVFGEVSVSGGSFDRLQGQFDIGGPVGDGDVFYRVTGLARNGDTQVDFAKDDRFFIAPAVTWKPSDDTTLTVLANYQRDRAGWGLQFLPASGTIFPRNGKRIPVNRFAGDPSWNDFDTDQASIGYLLEHKFSEALVFRQNARYAYLKNDQRSIYGYGYLSNDPDSPDYHLFGRSGDLGRSRLHSFAVDNNIQAKFETGPLSHTVLAGLDYRRTRYTDFAAYADASPIDLSDPDYGAPNLGAFTPYSDGRTTQDQVGVYAQSQIKFDRLSLVLGGRQDWADTDVEDRLGTDAKKSASAFTGKAGLIYNFDSGFAPYVSYSESFLPPLDRGPDGLLKPETGRQYEAGLKFQPTGWNSFITAAAFDLTRQNVVRYVNGIAGQVGEIRSRGIEVEGVASLAEGLNLRAAYTYLDTEITEGPNKGNNPYGVSKHRFSMWSDYTLQTGALKGVGFGAGVRVVGSMQGDDANTFRVPSATVFDAALTYKRDSYELALNGSNIFDKRYVASCYVTGDWGCFYAEGRKVIAKATYRW